MIERLVLFGASGDLAGRYLLPALASLLAAGKLPAGFRVVGAAREEWDDETFRLHALHRLEQHASSVPVETRNALAALLSYRPVNLEAPDSLTRVVQEALGSGDAPAAVYLALPPSLYPPVATALGKGMLPAGSRIVVEKPYGDDLRSTEGLNGLLERTLGTAAGHAVFRVDHVLGMATAQNLLGMRLANPFLEAVWNGEHVEEVDVLWEEDLALEGRASFYDRAGALKDVLQNHMLQMLCLVAMELPASLDERDLHEAKLSLLRSVHGPAPDEMTSRTRRARYTAGRIGDRVVPAYADEEGVDPSRDTETFAEVLLTVDTSRWAGTRFVMRAGKGLCRMRREVVVRFRRSLHLRGGEASGGGTEFRIGIDGPEDLSLRVMGMAAGPSLAFEPLVLVGSPPPSKLPAYGNVLMDILSGGSALSVGSDEAEEEWRIVTPILNAWAAGRVPMEEYPAGSSGPPRSEAPV